MLHFLECGGHAAAMDCGGHAAAPRYRPLAPKFALVIVLLLCAPQLPAQHPCDGRRAGEYPCSNIDLLAFIPRAQFGAPVPQTLNDVWGWTDPETGREYALAGLANGTAFVDITSPAEPRVIGRLPTATVDSLWRSIKVYGNFAYIVADRAGTHGVQVFDLRQLRTATPGTTFRATARYLGPGLGLLTGQIVGSAHNVVVNEQSGFAYAVGSRGTCGGGLHMIDVRTPDRPRFAGCFAQDGYTHDAQCVVYRGSDAAYRGREVCFASNEDTLTIVDVEEKRSPRMLSRTSYTDAGYTHQAWLTDDHDYLLMNDEADEIRFGYRTRTIIWDVRDLDRPRVIGQYLAANRAIDHNLYVHRGLVFEANYTSGLRVLDARDVAAGRLTEVAYFDIVPETDEPQFGGAWNVYPFFPSGTIVVSGIESGLFVLRLRVP